MITNIHQNAVFAKCSQKSSRQETPTNQMVLRQTPAIPKFASKDVSAAVKHLYNEPFPSAGEGFTSEDSVDTRIVELVFGEVEFLLIPRRLPAPRITALPNPHAHWERAHSYGLTISAVIYKALPKQPSPPNPFRVMEAISDKRPFTSDELPFTGQE